MIQFLIVGLSHLIQRHARVEFFTWLRERGHEKVDWWREVTVGGECE